jgi:hypothetical protein
MSVLDTLTEGIRQRSLSREGEAILEKWERTGLLEGLDDNGRSNMARLLENQAGQLLRETTTMQAGDVEGFASVAFPIVRRVFGGLLAQDLVSVQPMSLPSGLIFFMDFVYSPDSGMEGSGAGPAARLSNVADTSLYGGGVTGRQLTGGVNLADANQQRGFYGLNNGFSSPTGSIAETAARNVIFALASGTFGDTQSSPGGAYYDILRSDPDLTSGSSTYAIARVQFSESDGFNQNDLQALVLSGTNGAGALGTGGYHATRLNVLSGSSLIAGAEAVLIAGISRLGSRTAVQLSESMSGSHATAHPQKVRFPKTDQFAAAGDPFGALAGANSNQGWGLENNEQIPSIDIKVDSVAVTAVTKKLKAKWTPELAQDLNAYHNLDAEVELTSILSEQIALEIDQEILSDLVSGATGGTLYWSRLPGKFVNRETGAILGSSLFPDFTGTVSEWYETLLETVNEVSARIHRKTLRGGANFIVCSPEVANILEFTAGFRASATVDEESGSWGVKQVGSLSRKMDVHVDPYFLRNVILVGRKGSSFLESGFVYAPYVPLQVTPTIFGTEDFVPRKGVMTRYAKKMVRPDMYGLVVVADLIDALTD